MKMTNLDTEEDNQSFASRAAAHFTENPKHWTYTDGDISSGCMFAMKYGLGNDCVVIFKLDGEFEPINYQEIMTPIKEFSASVESFEKTKEQTLLDTLDKSHDHNPFLWFELGYTRPTGWMVHITDKSGGGSNKIVQTESESREKACCQATTALNEFFNEFFNDEDNIPL